MRVKSRDGAVNWAGGEEEKTPQRPPHPAPGLVLPSSGESDRVAALSSTGGESCSTPSPDVHLVRPSPSNEIDQQASSHATTWGSSRICGAPQTNSAALELVPSHPALLARSRHFTPAKLMASHWDGSPGNPPKPTSLPSCSPHPDFHPIAKSLGWQLPPHRRACAMPACLVR